LNEVEHFVRCIQSGTNPRTDGKFGLDVVRAIEMAVSNRWTPAELITAA
jgi:predicted dehydrogenase